MSYPIDTTATTSASASYTPPAPAVLHDVSLDQVKQIEEQERELRVREAGAGASAGLPTHTTSTSTTTPSVQAQEDLARQEKLKAQSHALIDPTSSAKQAIDAAHQVAQAVKEAVQRVE
ncbi:hypothetical protein HDU93_007811 [Gonapodya sp. JEL0774]|nr:hypothetical protein HDU93_007811 [Gonapodya sp. JEL0774]